MNDLTGLFDAFYSRLLLRDFFGKVVPGTIIILSACVVIFPVENVIKYIYEASFFSSLILIGFSWIVAFSVQAIGETFQLIRYHTYSTNNEFYARRLQFHKKANNHEHQQLERLAVIKEACGNTYVALALSAVLITIQTLLTSGKQSILNNIEAYWPAITFIASLVVFLAVMHFIHVRRQDEYMNTILNEIASVEE